MTLPSQPPGCDIFISIGAKRSAGRWFYELSGYRPLQNMAAGLQVSATQHTLLSFATVCALKSINDRAAETILFRAGEQALALSGRLRKVRVGIRCADHEFLDCLTAGINRSTPGFRCAASLMPLLRKQFARFDIRFLPTSLASLRQAEKWAEAVLPSKRFLNGLVGPSAKMTH